MFLYSSSYNVIRGRFRCGISFIALAADTSVDMERLSTYSTHRGGGTFPYMSPEQQEPNRKVPIECKTDIYSLGIILFELHYPKNTSEDERSLVCLK